MYKSKKIKQIGTKTGFRRVKKVKFLFPNVK